MFDIAPDHAIGLYAGLLILPLALLALRLRRTAAARLPGTVRVASVLLAVAGAIHLGLVFTHTDEKVTALLFALNGFAYIILSQLYAWRWWRPAAEALIAATMVGYLVYIVLGFDSPDQVAVATKLLELTTLGLVLIPPHGETRRRAMRWTALAAAVPLLTIVTTATVWIDALARPDAQHAHAGAVLQATNEVATPEQAAAARQLYAETAAAIAPYRDWRAAWAAGYRPSGSQATPSTHWMNQRYVDAGYVLDPRHPQGLVYANTRHGPELIGAMFEMRRIGQFGPDPGGPLTAWHQHENVCFTPFGLEFSLMTPTATCPVGSIDISAPPMLHVWIVPNPGGQFAVDIDEKLVRRIDAA